MPFSIHMFCRYHIKKFRYLTYILKTKAAKNMQHTPKEMYGYTTSAGF